MLTIASPFIEASPKAGSQAKSVAGSAVGVFPLLLCTVFWFLGTIVSMFVGTLVANYLGHCHRF